jgi:hypothetical protein
MRRDRLYKLTAARRPTGLDTTHVRRRNTQLGAIRFVSAGEPKR